MDKSRIIKCPHCNKNIDTNNVIYHQLEAEFEEQMKEKRVQYKKAIDELQTKENKYEQTLKAETEKRVKQEIIEQEIKLRNKIDKENKDNISILKQELDEKSKQVQELNKKNIQIETLKRENKEIESKIQAKSQRELNEQLQLQKEEMQKRANTDNELKLKEKDEQLEQIKKQLQIANQKATQNSMQLQGEAQELAIEEYLKNEYPFDEIQEIKKGARGADCLQIINTREMLNCGTIYYESKRTKDFKKEWIEKFKTDMMDKKVDAGVIVTQAMPSNMKRFGLLDGVWICTFDEFKGLSYALRQNIIQIYNIKKSQINKTDKMSLLYEYLISNEFKMQIEAIADGFIQMQQDLDSEKRAMHSIWKKREKQIEKVLASTTGMHGSIKGIAGNAIQDIRALELPLSGELEE